MKFAFMIIAATSAIRINQRAKSYNPIMAGQQAVESVEDLQIDRYYNPFQTDDNEYNATHLQIDANAHPTNFS